MHLIKRKDSLVLKAINYLCINLLSFLTLSKTRSFMLRLLIKLHLIGLARKLSRWLNFRFRKFCSNEQAHNEIFTISFNVTHDSFHEFQIFHFHDLFAKHMLDRAIIASFELYYFFTEFSFYFHSRHRNYRKIKKYLAS